jgi:class 3 adenylate cyclase
LKTIFIVDDNDTNLMAAKATLEGKYNSYALPSAEKMFKFMEKIMPDLILLDVDMPEMNGLEAITILKEKPETKDIPVIFLTARAESEDELEGLSLGAIDYITKPFKPSLLLKRIEVHLLVQDQRRTLEKQALDLKYFNDHLRKALSTYLSGDVVNAIIDDPSKLQLGGIKRHMTVLFTDIKYFSSIVEKLEPEKLVELLNYYLSTMSDIILDQKGTIDKFMGDGIIAFFGAPLELSDHALRACTASIIMKRLENEVNENITAKGISPLFTRIGINTDKMAVGNMGTEKKMNYTIMGNAVNLASRLEGINKIYGTWILVSENTIKETNQLLLSRQLDRVKVVGINEPVRIHEVLETKADAPPALHEKVHLFNKAHSLFEL